MFYITIDGKVVESEIEEFSKALEKAISYIAKNLEVDIICETGEVFVSWYKNKSYCSRVIGCLC